MSTRIRALISGRVQGVFFRANTKALAERLGIKGWVRNLRNGKVEVIGEGPEPQLKKFISFLHRGPEGAEVTDIQITKEKPANELKEFTIKY